MQAEVTPNTVFYRPSSTTEDSDPSGWIVAYSPDGRLVEKTFGIPSPTREAAERRLAAYERLAAGDYPADLGKGVADDLRYGD